MKKFLYLFPVISIIYVCLPLFNHQFFAVHDDQQIARTFLMSEALSSGQFPARWVNHLGFGFGYPLFIFYPPLIYYLSSLLHFGGLTLIDSVKVIIFLSFLLSLISEYLLLKKFFPISLSLIGASTYILTSYRSVDVYVRGALSEAFSFVFLPLILLFIYELFQKPFNKKNVILLSLSFAGLILTHTLTALGFSLIIVVWIAFLFLRIRKVSSVLVVIGSLLLGVGISAFSSIPSLLEKKSTLVDDILLTQLADYRIHFVYLRQLWNSMWGYGGSLPGLNDDLSFEIGKLLILIIPVLIAIILYKFFKTRKLPIIVIFPILLVFSAIMTTNYSKPIWFVASPLAYLQFPWRYLAFVTLFAPFVFVYFAQIISKRPIRAIMVMIFIFCVVFIESIGKFQPKELQNFTDSDYLTKARLDWATSRSSFEYIPKGVITKISPDATTIPDIDENDLPQTQYQIFSGSGQMINKTFFPGRQTYFSSSANGISVRFNTFNFPGWQAKIDGQNTSISSNNPYKLIEVTIPSGEHRIDLNFTRTNIRLISEIISLVSLLGLIIIFFFVKNVRGRHDN